MRIAALLIAALASPAAAHLNIYYEVRGPGGVQYQITTQDSGQTSGTIPAGGSQVGTVVGYINHDGSEALTATFNDGMGAVACATVPFGVFEPQWHFQTTCRPTFAYNGVARTCTSTCETAPPMPTGDGRPKAFPNPVRAGQDAMFLVNLPADSRVRIYSVTGRLEYEGRTSASGNMHWHCLDNAGRHVGPGVYLAVIEGGGRVVKLKLAIQH